MTYCIQCRRAVPPDIAFCPQCGARQVPAAPAAMQPIPPVKPRSAVPFVLVVLGILALVAVAGIGGVVYVGYRVKEKVTSVAHTITAPEPKIAPGEQQIAPAGQQPDPSANPDVSAVLGNLGKMLGGGDEEGDPVESISAKDPVVPCTPAPYPAQGAAQIPLQPGTVVTTAWGMLNGDVESRETVSSLGPSSVTLSSTTEEYKDDNNHPQPRSSSKHTVCNADFLTSNIYATVTGASQPEIVHDLTRLRLSDKSFQEIRSTGKTYFVYWDVMTSGQDAVKPDREGGLLTRVEPQDVAYPMIVNDQRVTLQAIHLAGVTASVGKDPRPMKDRPQHTETDVYVIDDPADPLVLLLKLKDPNLHDNKFRVEDTKIDYPVPHPVNLVEKQLSEQKRAVTYGIYFDFNKDTIKPESEPVLKEIVQAMTNNPDWKLTVEGNTDNIGGDTYNLDLSRRRAAAVKQTLVDRYHIAANRLSTDGYGSSHPIETNDTLEGRARNRRVELTRE